MTSSLPRLREESIRPQKGVKSAVLKETEKDGQQFVWKPSNTTAVDVPAVVKTDFLFLPWTILTMTVPLTEKRLSGIQRVEEHITPGSKLVDTLLLSRSSVGIATAGDKSTMAFVPTKNPGEGVEAIPHGSTPKRGEAHATLLERVKIWSDLTGDCKQSHSLWDCIQPCELNITTSDPKSRSNWRTNNRKSAIYRSFRDV